MTPEQREAVIAWMDYGGPLHPALEPVVREILIRQEASAAMVRAWAKRNGRSVARIGAIPEYLRRDYVWETS